MKEIKISDQPRLLNELVEAISQAAGASGQLIHTMNDPRWMVIREALDLTKEGVLKLATFAASKVTAVRPS